MPIGARTKRLLALGCAFSSCFPAAWVAAGEPMALGFVETGQQILGFNSAASSRFAISDVDDDGISDLVFCATSGGSALLVSGRLDDGGVGFKQVYFLTGSGAIVRVLSADAGTTKHVYAVADDGTVHDFTGWPLHESRTFHVAEGATAAAIGDLLGDGHNNLVVLTADQLHAYDLDTGVELWSYAVFGANDLVLAQLDDDPTLEIVVDSMPGLVLDGATRAIDWQYIDGFGYPLAAGQLLGDSTTQFIAVISYSQFTVFRGSPWSPLWSGGDAIGGISALATARIDQSGRDVHSGRRCPMGCRARHRRGHASGAVSNPEPRLGCQRNGRAGH